MTSIYYRVNRSYPLTQIEQEQVAQILKECEANYPYPYDDMDDESSLEMQTEVLFFLIQ